MTAGPLAPIPAERYGARLRAAVDELHRRGMRALLVGVGPDLEYLTGYRALPLERLTMLVLPADDAPLLVVPRLEESAARAGLGIALELATWGETDDPYELVARRLEASAVDAHAALGVSDRLWASHFLRLQARLPAARFEPASRTLRALRAVKDAAEIERLRLAAEAADRVVEQIAGGRLVGRSEADVAAEVRARLVAEGHERAEFAIVAAGPNSASPHHEASERVIAAGEPIVLDIGGSLGGYGSDITRTIWVTGGDQGHGPDETFRLIFELVRRAQAEATAAIRPGVPAERIDAVARDVIAAGGFGPSFIHRTGHGIGLEAHEDPYLVAGNDEPLRAGAAFSVEPGIYLDGRYGVRIEDIVVCREGGPDVLNVISRELRVVDG